MTATLLPRSTKKAQKKDKAQNGTVLDLGKIKITPLPRRTDEIYMRNLRRRRA